MATLNGPDLANMRQRLVAADATLAPLTKPTINAALQAIEDTFTAAGIQSALSTAINAATSPTVLTNAQKKLLVAEYILNKAGRDGA